MAPTIPSQSLDWRFNVNVDATEADDETHRASMLLSIVNFMLSGGSGWTDSSGASATPAFGWAVAASSNAVTADATNRWSTTADLVWATSPTAFSWIVLEHSTYFGASDGLQMLITCSEAASGTRNGTIGVYLSRAGFDLTTPSTTARPTATDEIEVLNHNGTTSNASWQGADTNDEDHRVGRLHFKMTSDGRNMRIGIARLSAVCAFWCLSYNTDYAGTAMTIPVSMAIISQDSDANVLTWQNFRSASFAQFVTRDDTIGGEFRGQARMPYSRATDDEASSEPACNVAGLSVSALDPIRLRAVAPGAGTFHTILDMWWGRAALDQESYPDDGSRQLQQFGVVVGPWNGSIALFS